MINFGDSRLPSRFWDKVIPEPNSGCWLFFTSVMTVGYGSLTIKAKRYYAHRLAYETLVGVVPTGLELDHLCRTRCCCNPAHLEPVTRQVNTLRGRAGEASKARHLAQTHCKHGHELTPENTAIVTKNGSTYRQCILCRRDADVRLYQNQRRNLGFEPRRYNKS